jgi:hypothetical protein
MATQNKPVDLSQFLKDKYFRTEVLYSSKGLFGTIAHIKEFCMGEQVQFDMCEELADALMKLLRENFIFMAIDIDLSVYFLMVNAPMRTSGALLK